MQSLPDRSESVPGRGQTTIDGGALKPARAAVRAADWLKRRFWLSPLGFGSIAGVVTMAVTAVVALQIATDYQRTVDHGEIRVRDAARELEVHVRETFEALQPYFELPRHAMLAGQFDRQATENTFQHVLKAHRLGIASVLIIDDSGTVIVDSSGVFSGTLERGLQTFFPTSRDWDNPELQVISGVIDPHDGRPAIAIAQRLESANNDFVGIVLGILEPDYLTAFARAHDASDDAEFILMAEDGSILGRAPMTADVSGKPLSGLLGAHGHWLKKDNDFGRVVSPIDGVERFERYLELPDLPVAALIGLSVSKIMAPWYSHLWLTLGITVAFLIAIWLAFALIARSFGALKAALVALGDARAEAEGANLAKDTFLANMSHELRTPLNAVIGFADLLSSDHFGTLNDKQREYVQDIGQSGHHLLNIINDILDHAKLGVGQYRLSPEPVSLHEIVNSCLRLVRPKIDEKKLALMNLVPNNLPMLMADHRAIVQVMLNLLSNAVKFTPEAGHITIDAAMDADSGCYFAVSDSGIGIAQDALSQVFEPFQQADTTIARRFEGTGLGLSISRDYMRLHGGSLEIESELGQGTRVTARFPADAVIAPS
jgi:signal transduction histidine kinase